ncbi:beta-ketoacyl-[acyl-carrier-protein] synthase family protein [Mesorhizobium sp. NPDC059054]|uniref:beta-ketoacyl-[acyl-carrier-protein] synthase family protein n=1 Tax=Mesorhizobium sp. NPDC059054 TaxID=3346711 RepID=UPI0036CA9813
MATDGNDVVVSAFGAVTPIGVTYEEIERALRTGKSGIRKIHKYDTDSFKVKHAGVPELGNEKIRWPSSGAPVIGDILYVRAALKSLRAHEGFQLDQYEKDRIGCFLGADEPVADVVQITKCILEAEPDATSLEERAKVISRNFRIGDFINYSPVSALKQVQDALGFEGPAFSHIGLCSASLQAIGTGFQAIRRGRLDAAIVGGVSAKISPEHFIGLEAADVIASDGTVPPEERSRPFDKWRSGYIPAEGAVLFVLERKKHVESSGRAPLLRIAGYGASLNASHIVKPHLESREMELSMRRAIRDAGLDATDIDLVNAHGTSTQLNDFHESRAINTVFGRPIPVTANKSIHGHMIAAAGAMETLNCLISSLEGFIPGTINIQHQDPACDVTVVRKTVDARPRNILKNSFGMGGLAATVVLESCS